jgi:probable F420-dependent oxidoreductase
MKFGVCLPNYGPAASAAAIGQIAQAAEAAGYASVWATDHILVPEKHGQPYGQVIEAFITLGYLAGVTQNLTLATSILVLPQRDPLLVARQAAAIDQLSGGRVILGVGVGWIEEEFRFLRTDFRQRGHIINEWIQVLRTLWSEARPTFQGNWIDFENTVFEPKPVQSNGPPIYIGGESDAAIRRAAMLGDGWHPGSLESAALASSVAKLREWAGGRSVVVSLRGEVDLNREAEVIRSDTGTRYQRLGGSISAVVDMVGALAEAGLEYFVCYFEHQSAGQLLAQLEQFATAVIPAFRK